jgi:hypothetical protein
MRRATAHLTAAIIAAAVLIAAPPLEAQIGGGSCIPVDTTVASFHTASGDQHRVRDLIDSLEKSAAAATTASLPALYLELGRAKTAYVPTPDYAKARPNEYFYNEIAGDWLYRGWHFEQILQRFATSDLADDAAYEMTKLVPGGECEGYIACYVHVGWQPVAEFLRAYPRSAFATEGIKRAIRAFSVIGQGMDLRGGSEYIDPPEIRRLIVELDTLASTLRGTMLGARLYARSGELWQQLGEYDFAREVYRNALPTLDAPTRTCIAARLAAMPARSFALDPVRVIHPKRAEVNWASVDGATRYVVYRSGDRVHAGEIAAQLPGTAVGWVDTTVSAGDTHWYRVVAQTPQGTVESIPASAEIPTTRLRVNGMAISTTDRSVYLLGELSNGFPQVVRVSEDGNVGRVAGYYGHTYSASGIDFRPYVSELLLVDAGGVGVLRFTGSALTLPAALRASVRAGAALLDSLGERSTMVSVDESVQGAWLERGGGTGRLGASAMDCIGAAALCWVAGSGGVELRDARGVALARTAIDPRGAQPPIWPRAVYANPADSSAWVLLSDQGRLLLVDRTGVVRQDVILIDKSRGYSLRLAADFDRNLIWFTRSPDASVELVRMELGTPELRRSVTRLDGVPAVQHLVPDLAGGLWILGRQDQLVRVDGSGRVTKTVTLSLH